MKPQGVTGEDGLSQGQGMLAAIARDSQSSEVCRNEGLSLVHLPAPVGARDTLRP